MLSSLSGQAEDRAPAKAGNPSSAAASEQDLLLLGPLEPMHLRLMIEIDGVPFRTVWRTFADRLIDQFDVDRDGRLTAEQTRQLLAVFVPAGTPLSTPDRSAKQFMMSDSTIKRDEILNQIERIAPPLALRQRLSSGGAGPALVPLLDVDGDGRLSQEELNYAEHSLHCRDFNDDQLIIKQELLAGPNVSSTGSIDENGVSNGSVILLPPTIEATAVAEILLARYDRNRDGELSMVAPAEISAMEGRLATLDKNGNHSLDRSELLGFLELPVDASLPINLGSGRAESKRPAQALPQYRLRKKSSDGGYQLFCGASEIKFARNNRDPSQDNTRPRLQDFDANTNKTLDEAEFNNVPNHPEMAVVDTDRDGTISDSEFEAYFLQRSKATSVQLILEVSDQGSDLFKSLDENGDQVLTPRELHRAAGVLKREDRDGDGFLGGVEMSYKLSLDLSRGGSRPLTNNIVGMRTSSDPQVKADRTGPGWFIKMDRNRDGDVSLSEFIGSRAIFTNLDQNADGLISNEEAAAATETSDGK